MRYVALVALLVSISAREADAECVTTLWFGVPASGKLPPRGSLYIQEARAKFMEGRLHWSGGTGSLSYTDVGDDVVRVDYEAGSSRSLDARLDYRHQEFAIGELPRPSSVPIVIELGHEEYHGEFICGASSMAILTIDRPVAAFHAVWTKPCDAGRCVFSDRILASRTVGDHGELRLGSLGCGTIVMPAMPDFDRPNARAFPDDLELTLTAIEFDRRETPILGVPSWSALEDAIAREETRENAMLRAAVLPLGRWAALVGTLLGLVALTARVAWRFVKIRVAG